MGGGKAEWWREVKRRGKGRRECVGRIVYGQKTLFQYTWTLWRGTANRETEVRG